jgi:AraC-like DNA-binding protein
MRSGDPSTTSDPLGEALHFLRLAGSFYCRSELTAPWGLHLPPEPGSMWFHVVNTGRCWLDVDGHEPRQLQPGDFALVPHGEGHLLYSESGTPTPRFDELEYDYASDRYAILRQGGGQAPTSIVCGTVRFGHPAARSLVALLPRMIIIDGAPGSQSPEADWMYSTLRLIAAEARELRPAGEAVITRLSDILVIQAIRSWITSDAVEQTGWLGALRDPRIGRAMSLVHRDPARPWSVASLAREITMSRSAFAARFTELVGEPVMRYVTRWRMQVALDLLHHDDLSVSELASRLGYDSEAAFSRAFKRTIGISPGTVRRTPPEALLNSSVGPTSQAAEIYHRGVVSELSRSWG